MSNDGMLQPYEFAMSLVTFAPSVRRQLLKVHTTVHTCLTPPRARRATCHTQGAKSTLLARAEGLKTMKVRPAQPWEGQGSPATPPIHANHIVPLYQGAISKAEFMEFQRFLDCLDELEVRRLLPAGSTLQLICVCCLQVALQLVASSDDGVTQGLFALLYVAQLLLPTEPACTRTQQRSLAQQLQQRCECLRW